MLSRVTPCSWCIGTIPIKLQLPGKFRVICNYFSSVVCQWYYCFMALSFPSPSSLLERLGMINTEDAAEFAYAAQSCACLTSENHAS